MRCHVLPDRHLLSGCIGRLVVLPRLVLSRLLRPLVLSCSLALPAPPAASNQVGEMAHNSTSLPSNEAQLPQRAESARAGSHASRSRVTTHDVKCTSKLHTFPVERRRRVK